MNNLPGGGWALLNRPAKVAYDSGVSVQLAVVAHDTVPPGKRSVKTAHFLRDGDEIKSASGRSRVRQNAGLRREFQACVLANAATNAGFIYARFLSRWRQPGFVTSRI